MTSTDTRTSIPTTIVECACKHCTAYATRRGLTLPLRAEVNVKMAAAICTGAKGRHAMVKSAHQPLAGYVSANQATYGPWVA
jgi:hypothetical protein